MSEFDRMVTHFLIRLNTHIDYVNHWYEKVYETATPDMKEMMDLHRIDLQDHDVIKFEEPERTPYIHTMWTYKCKKSGVVYRVSEKLQEQMNEATIHHIVNSKHHPEYWDKNFDPKTFNTKDRDKPGEGMVDATDMPRAWVIEWVCDWMATATERNTDPYAWGDMNINKRWKLDVWQEKLIYHTLDAVWKEENKPC